MFIYSILLVLAIVALLVFAYIFNPFREHARRLYHSTKVQLYPSIRVMERDNDRLFVLEPEQSIMYNTAGVLYYYFEGGVSARICPNNEFAIVRLGRHDISNVNSNGNFYIACTTTGPLQILHHFESNSIETTIPIFDTEFNLLEIINYLIRSGLAYIKY
ncbi:hypothetical protein SlGVgp079 [Spodoptera litura granulovirus]|uniref:Pif-4 n=1 Tax=Spodoptera litura granulovirus TaxID=359919 RepID=A5IZT1_9BBAC|nr:hypothetical protein SlGVgp079 [Spodoptera litura granulovirus]ABQ52022.1 hypothetical protein SlGVgp079 [Spodoptera litura granulovirus]